MWFAVVSMVVTYLIIAAIITGLIIFLNRTGISLAWLKTFTFYLAILLLITLLYYGVVEPGSEPVPGKAYRSDLGLEYRHNIHNKILSEILDKISNGQVKEEYSEEIIAEGQWSFAYDREHLKITTGKYYPYPIVVSRKEEEDGTVEVTCFTFTPPFSNVPELELSKDRLVITPVTAQLVHLAQDFTTAQFTGKRAGNMAIIGYLNNLAGQLLYLEVPPGIEIESDELTIIYN